VGSTLRLKGKKYQKYREILFTIGNLDEVPDRQHLILLELPPGAEVSYEQKEDIVNGVHPETGKHVMRATFRALCDCRQNEGDPIEVVACALTTMRRIADWALQFYNGTESEGYKEMDWKIKANRGDAIEFKPPGFDRWIPYAKYRSTWEEKFP